MSIHSAENFMDRLVEDKPFRQKFMDLTSPEKVMSTAAADGSDSHVVKYR